MKLSSPEASGLRHQWLSTQVIKAGIRDQLNGRKNGQFVLQKSRVEHDRKGSIASLSLPRMTSGLPNNQTVPEPVGTSQKYQIRTR